MADRATYLARLFITRLRNLEVGLDDGRSPDEPSKYTRRREMVAKVLAVETGATDERTVQLVTNSLPNILTDHAPSDRDFSELASFLRAKIDLELK